MGNYVIAGVGNYVIENPSDLGNFMIADNMRARMDDLVAKLQAHYARPPLPPPTPAVGYAAADLSVLFPGAFE